MKRVPIRTVPGGTFAGRDTGPLDYAAALTALLEGNANGMTVAEMRTALSVNAAIEAARERGAEFVLLEDQAHQHLVARLNGNKWPAATAALLAMIDAVIGAETVDPNAPAPALSPQAGDPVA
jgi:hypothetical protein